MAARSRHRSQDQGRSYTPGARRTGFDLVEDPAAPVQVAPGRSFGRNEEGPAESTPSMFAGVDTLLSQRAQSAAEATGNASLDQAAALLLQYEELVATARADFNPLAPWELQPTLSVARDRLEAAAQTLATVSPEAGSGAVDDLKFHIRAEFEDLQAALLRTANVELSAVASDAALVPGQSFRLELSVWNGGPEAVRAQARPLLPRGWSAELVAGSHSRLAVDPGARESAIFRVTVPDDARLTMPYYLDPWGPEPVDLYQWPDDLDVRGLPFAPPPIQGSFAVSLTEQSAPIPAHLDAVHLAVDPRSGELQQPVKVIPAVAVAAEPQMAVVRVAQPKPFPVTVRLRPRGSDGSEGELHLDLPAGWTSDPASAPVEIEPGVEQVVTFQVRPPVDVTAERYDIEAHLEADGEVFSLGYDVVDYPHIAPHNLYRVARTRVQVMDVEVADVRVGYVPGAGDGIPGALDQLGLQWETLDAADLAAGDFDRFDVVVTGIRAYEVNDALVAHNQALLDWVRGGGTLIVEYNKYEALDRDYTPWPVTIARPHGRVTDETAPVRILEPDNPVFNTPNMIGPADWEGWVQERGLYFWDTWDDSLTPLLAMSDPGEDDLLGSLLVGPLGRGTYVYTALAFFRQLPAGVPGAYRVLANLLSLGAR